MLVVTTDREERKIDDSQNCKVLANNDFQGLESYDAVIMTLPALEGGDEETSLGGLDPELKDGIQTFIRKSESKGKAGNSLCFDLNPALRLGVFFEGKDRSKFQNLVTAADC